MIPPSKAPTTWAECHALLETLPPDALAIAAEEAARAALLSSNGPADAGATTAEKAVEAVALWRAQRIEPDALKRAAEAAYHAAHTSAHPPGAPERSIALAAAHAAFAAFFLSQRAGADPGMKQKVFAAARNACEHANAAAGGTWKEFSAPWARHWWSECIRRLSP
jgi:hypothetical protein